MSLTCLICHLVWMSLVAMNRAQLEEPDYKELSMMVCPKQQTTEQFIDSFKASSLAQCAVRCFKEKLCQSANLCYSDGAHWCTLSRKFPWAECAGNTGNTDCRYLVTKTPCLNGGTANGTGQYCMCPSVYTGEFCERFYYDCWEPGAVSYGETWIQRGGHPPFEPWCYYGDTFVLRVLIGHWLTDDFALNKTFDEYKTRFLIHSYFNGGLETIHTATSQAHYTLKLKVHVSIPFKVITTYYHNFTLASASQRYRLDYLSVTGGPDGLAAMKGRPFSAVGNDPDGCAQRHNVAWWYTADCQTPMVYNDNEQISFPDENDRSIFKDCEALYMYLVFEGLK